MVTLSFGKNFRRRYRHLWAMVVTGFDDREHCLKCLKGTRVKEVTVMARGGSDFVEVDVPEGAFLYLCGVVYPFDWSSNFHLVLRRAPEVVPDLVDVDDPYWQVRTLPPSGPIGGFIENCFGDMMGFRNAEMVEFDDQKAKALYPNLGPEFLTCRNFQFGAHYFR